MAITFTYGLEPERVPEPPSFGSALESERRSMKTLSKKTQPNLPLISRAILKIISVQ